ncbi:uncharacterized protein BDV14DRAFT_201227 [Aspergillus stella-maris]|uniref:uncharacterized protein n=1 Tax=Aspergillus stella-maris TaxID=1810926 RepID=UPI003CCCC15D
MSRPPLRSTFPSVRIDADDAFICPCGYRVKDFLVKKESSPYRGTKFYACPKNISDPARCKTTIWFDEQDKVRNLIPPSMQSPRTPRRQVDIRIFGAYTPSTTFATGEKRKRNEMEWFDSAVGDLERDQEEPASPSAIRSAKSVRARYGYVDAATQTGEESQLRSIPPPRSAPATRPVPRKMPRRRLFDEYLPPSHRKTITPFDPFAPAGQEKDKGGSGDDLYTSTPPRDVRPLQDSSAVSGCKPARSAKNIRVSFCEDLSSDRAGEAPQPTTPSCPKAQNATTGLLTPPASKWPRNPQLRRPTSPRGPRTPSRSINTLQVPSRLIPEADSDNESFGWNEELEKSFLDAVDEGEKVKPRESERFSPLFV